MKVGCCHVYAINAQLEKEQRGFFKKHDVSKPEDEPNEDVADDDVVSSKRRRKKNRRLDSLASSFEDELPSDLRCIQEKDLAIAINFSRALSLKHLTTDDMARAICKVAERTHPSITNIKHGG